MNVLNTAREGRLQPVFGIGGETELTEGIAPALRDCRGHAPVRVGHQAHEHFRHDTYGAIVPGAAPAFFDRRLLMNLGADAFARLEPLGEQARRLHASPDAGIWELRTRARVHTSSSVMCRAGCDRLAKIATHLGLRDRAAHWRGRADAIKRTILETAWSEERGAFVESFSGRTLDASALLMGEVGFIPPDQPRFARTVDKLSGVLGRGAFMMRHEDPDDFGPPRTGFNVCTFRRSDALARLGRREEAREVFEALLEARTPLGPMSEDTEIATGEPWGNFPQTYSMVDIVNGARRLSDSRESRL